MKTFALLALLPLLLPSTASAGHLHPDRYYQELWCNAAGGQMEVVIDGLRIDCLTPELAVEHDFSAKYREGIIQALEYARLTGKQAVVVLIVERPEDKKYVERARRIVNHYELPVLVRTIP